MTAFVSLFRGINVGGNRLVRKDELTAVHESLGFHKVTPYIQSGNVIFSGDTIDDTSDAEVEQVRRSIEERFEQQLGFHAVVIVRTLAEINDIIDKNPFQGQEGRESKWIAVLFLAAHPDEAAQQALLKSYGGPEEIHCMGKELYIYYPDGMGRSKLTLNLMERKLKTVGTVRNLNTVLQLQKLLRAA